MILVKMLEAWRGAAAVYARAHEALVSLSWMSVVVAFFIMTVVGLALVPHLVWESGRAICQEAAIALCGVYDLARTRDFWIISGLLVSIAANVVHAVGMDWALLLGAPVSVLTFTFVFRVCRRTFTNLRILWSIRSSIRNSADPAGPVVLQYSETLLEQDGQGLYRQVILASDNKKRTYLIRGVPDNVQPRESSGFRAPEAATPYSTITVTATLPPCQFSLEVDGSIVGQGFRYINSFVTADHVYQRIRGSEDVWLINYEGRRAKLTLRSDAWREILANVEGEQGMDVAILEPSTPSIWTLYAVKAVKPAGPVSSWGKVSFRNKLGCFTASGPVPCTLRGVERTHQIATEPGCSGAPIINRDGRVLGVHLAAAGDGKNNLFQPSCFLAFVTGDLLSDDPRNSESDLPEKKLEARERKREEDEEEEDFLDSLDELRNSGAAYAIINYRGRRTHVQNDESGFLFSAYDPRTGKKSQLPKEDRLNKYTAYNSGNFKRDMEAADATTKVEAVRAELARLRTQRKAEADFCKEAKPLPPLIGQPSLATTPSASSGSNQPSPQQETTCSAVSETAAPTEKKSARRRHKQPPKSSSQSLQATPTPVAAPKSS
jgi:hypothetical protein